MILSGQEQDFKFLYVVRSKISGLDPSTKTRAPKLQNQERLKYSPEGYKWVPLIFKYEILGIFKMVCRHITDLFNTEEHIIYSKQKDQWIVPPTYLSNCIIR